MAKSQKHNYSDRFKELLNKKDYPVLLKLIKTRINYYTVSVYNSISKDNKNKGITGTINRIEFILNFKEENPKEAKMINSKAFKKSFKWLNKLGKYRQNELTELKNKKLHKLCLSGNESLTLLSLSYHKFKNRQSSSL
ncbi:MAG: hypothetical protein AB7O73_13805 [Bacteroidia bacterium]